MIPSESPMKERRKSFLLRIDEKLWDDLASWAGQDLRSVNGQIELILRRAVEARKKSNKDDWDFNR
jgi:hypothetical protein